MYLNLSINIDPQVCYEFSKDISLRAAQMLNSYILFALYLTFSHAPHPLRF